MRSHAIGLFSYSFRFTVNDQCAQKAALCRWSPRAAPGLTQGFFFFFFRSYVKYVRDAQTLWPRPHANSGIKKGVLQYGRSWRSRRCKDAAVWAAGSWERALFKTKWPPLHSSKNTYQINISWPYSDKMPIHPSNKQINKYQLTRSVLSAPPSFPVTCLASVHSTNSPKFSSLLLNCTFPGRWCGTLILLKSLICLSADKKI